VRSPDYWGARSQVHSLFNRNFVEGIERDIARSMESARSAADLSLGKTWSLEMPYIWKKVRFGLHFKKMPARPAKLLPKPSHSTTLPSREPSRKSTEQEANRV
jgi:hypothetical protein